MDDTFDRLENFDLDKVFQKNKDIKADFGGVSKRQEAKELTNFIMQGKKAPRKVETMSESCD